MGKHSFKKLSARVIRKSILMGKKASIDLWGNDWCDIVSSNLIPGPSIVFRMAGGNKDQKSTLDYEYKVIITN